MSNKPKREMIQSEIDIIKNYANPYRKIERFSINMNDFQNPTNPPSMAFPKTI